MGKTILLGMPAVSGLYKLIAGNLAYHGFNVINIVEDDLSFRYPSLYSRLYVKYRKLVCKDSYAKKQLKWQVLQDSVAQKIEAAGGLDYALFISADLYSREFLHFIKSQSRNGIVNYQFDGMHRYPAIYPLIDLFDRFYVFDPDDYARNRHNFLPATNFYFDDNLTPAGSPTSDFYFAGTHYDSRAPIIAALGDYAQQRNKSADINILWKHSQKKGRKIYPAAAIRLIQKHFSFEENIERMKRTNVLLDCVVEDHKGLSFRTFEAIGYRKKLITTNQSIIDYDFYHPDNFLVWNGKDFNILDKFLSVPYRETNEAVRQKYSFGNWINYILNIRPHTPICLPPYN